MRFPRISRLRWDKPPGEADRLDVLEKMLEGIEGAQTGLALPKPKRGSAKTGAIQS
jgi:hypothetical protein